jgi:hypothetical protein
MKKLLGKVKRFFTKLFKENDEEFIEIASSMAHIIADSTKTKIDNKLLALLENKTKGMTLYDKLKLARKLTKDVDFIPDWLVNYENKRFKLKKKEG